jgi:chemosensory pili system protein ChpA (sensor histidine kinase/response regulator)
MLADIEMPRMDGFDLDTQHSRRCAPARRADHHDHLAHWRRSTSATLEEIGVNHYLGKPYHEDELLALVARYAQAGKG